MDLVHEMTYHAMLRAPLPIGDGGFGVRMFFDVIDGTVDGPRIRGKFTGAGGDWLFETGDARYSWLNQSVFVGEGRVLEGFGVEYRVFRVV